MDSGSSMVGGHRDCIGCSQWRWLNAEIKRMLAYLIVAEVGYMVGGVWIYNYYGLIGSIFHVISDACMTLCLFLGAGLILRKAKIHSF